MSAVAGTKPCRQWIEDPSEEGNWSDALSSEAPRGREGPAIIRHPALSRASMKGPSALGNLTGEIIRSSALVEKQELQLRMEPNAKLYVYLVEKKSQEIKRHESFVYFKFTFFA